MEEAVMEKKKEVKPTKTLGERGIDGAAAFLERSGYEILDKSYENEIAIVAKDEDGLHFVQVITRMENGTGFPEESATREKRERFEKYSMDWLIKNADGADFGVHFDILSMQVYDAHKAFLKFHRNAFSED